MKIIESTITSRNNETVKWAASLALKKNREISRSFIAEGEKLTLEALSAGLPVSHIFVLEAKKDAITLRLSEFLNDKRYEETFIISVSETVFSKISTESAPQGVISVIKYLDFFRDADIIYKEEFLKFPNERAILLSSVRDPGNLGAVIRSAAAFGIDHILLTADSADLYNPKTVRSAMGSLFRVKCTVVADAVSTVKEIVSSGRRVLSAELREGAQSIFEASLKS